MRDLLDQLDAWRLAGERSVLARVVDTDGSGPRDAGAAMAVHESGAVVGSVSGGCVESAVVTEATAVLDGGPPRLVSFGYSDEEAFAVGLTCGGTVQLFLAAPPGTDELDALAEAVRAGRPVATATVVEGTGAGRTMVIRPDAEPVGSIGGVDLDRVVARDAAGELDAGTTAVRHYGPDGQVGEEAVTVFVESFAPPPRMIVFGAVDFTAALCRTAKLLGFRVTVCDAREVFATPARFPDADEVVVEWPHRYLERLDEPLGRRDAVCVLTHDNKFDVPALLHAFSSDVGYIGALGSRTTAAVRRERLVEAGATDADLARLHAPIGLDLGGRSPEETAISIAAEIIAHRNRAAAGPLRDTNGAIHRST